MHFAFGATALWLAVAPFAAMAAYPEPDLRPPEEQAPTSARSSEGCERDFEALGIRADDLSRAQALARGTLVMSGALILSVEQRGPAERADLQAGDVIIALNGTPVASAGALEDDLSLLPAGAPAELTLVRQQVTMPRTLRLAGHEVRESEPARQ